MNAWRMTVSCALAASAMLAAGAAAQKKTDKPADDKCKIDFGGNDQVRSAYNTITLLQIGSKNPDDARKKLKTAISSLTSKSDFGKDQNARNFALGQALVTWYQLPGSTPTATAADLGYGRQSGSVNLLAAADSAFTSVETANPDCADNASVFRQQPWAKLINQVGPLVSAEKLDSATTVLNQAMTIYRGSPYDYYFQGQIAQRKNDWPTAATAYGKAVSLVTPEMAAKDSNAAGVKEFSEFSAAYAQLRQAQTLSGPQQQDAMKKAAEGYRAYLKDYPSGANAQPAQAGLTAALKASGDTASLASLWKDMQASPTKYTDTQLYDAGTQAFTANQYPTAVALMELGRQQNPYLRPGLFNLANAYWKNNQFDKMLDVADTLIKIDPDNPDNYQLAAIAYQGLVKATTDPKQKKALTDSVSTYVTASDKLPVHVSFSQFTANDGSDKGSLAGEVENAGAKATTATLVVQFLDKTGQVVTSQTASLPLGPNEKKPFKLDIAGAKIAAYRYAPIVAK